MKKKSLLVFSIVLILSLVFLRKYWNSMVIFYTEQNVVFWRKGIEIGIDQYKGDADHNSTDDYHCYHAIMFQGESVQDAYARSFFDPYKSWITDTNYFYDCNLLQSYRFDLYEVYSRYYNKKINDLRNKKGMTLEELQKIGAPLHEKLLKHWNELYYMDLPRQEKIKYIRKRLDELLTETDGNEHKPSFIATTIE